MNQPLVSVVVPTYDRAHVIAETLDSVLAQTHPSLEIIVVDDGSVDHTEQVVNGRPYRDRVIYLRQRNQGLAGARNSGMLRATGAYVAWLDSDDIWHPEKVALQVAFLEQHPEYVLIASDFSAFDEHGFFEESHVRSYYSAIDRTPGGLAGIFPEQKTFRSDGKAVRVYGGHIYNRLMHGNCLHPPTVLFRRTAFLRAGLLDARFRHDTDYEYLLRLARQGSVALVDRPLMRYRYSPGQMSSAEHLREISLSRLLVLDELQQRHPRLVRDHGFRRRLGYSHLAVADALAEHEPTHAARHLLTSLRWGYADRQTAAALAKLLLPRQVVQGIRKRLQPTPSARQR